MSVHTLRTGAWRLFSPLIRVEHQQHGVMEHAHLNMIAGLLVLKKNKSYLLRYRLDGHPINLNP